MSVVSAVLLDRLRARGTGSFGNRTSLFTHFTYFTVRYTRLTDCTWTVHYTVHSDSSPSDFKSGFLCGGAKNATRALRGVFSDGGLSCPLLTTPHTSSYKGSYEVQTFFDTCAALSMTNDATLISGLQSRISGQAR